MSYILSYQSICLSLSTPCLSFESDIPVHRGSYFDVFFEIVTRTVFLFPELIEIACVAISFILPCANNLSYTSGVSIFKLLQFAFSQYTISSLKTTQSQENLNYSACYKMLTNAIHYNINRSVRENIPLVIVMMKNAKLLTKILKHDTEYDECDQLLLFIKNVNAELRQSGKSFKASELEVFFTDPSCEHFTLPVLRAPRPDYDFSTGIDFILEKLSSSFIV